MPTMNTIPPVPDHVTEWAATTGHTVTFKPKTDLRLAGTHAYNGWFIDFKPEPLAEPITLDMVKAAISPDNPDRVEIRVIPAELRKYVGDKVPQRKAVTSIRDEAKNLIESRDDLAVFGVGMAIERYDSRLPKVNYGADLTPYYPVGTRMGSAYESFNSSSYNQVPLDLQLIGDCAIPISAFKGRRSRSLDWETDYARIRTLLSAYLYPEWAATVTMVLHRSDLPYAVIVNTNGSLVDRVAIRMTDHWTPDLLDGLLAQLPPVTPLPIQDLACRVQELTEARNQAIAELLEASVTHYGATPRGVVEVRDQLFDSSSGFNYGGTYDSYAAPESVKKEVGEVLDDAFNPRFRTYWDRIHPRHRELDTEVNEHAGINWAR